jgi:hypothetical protein
VRSIKTALTVLVALLGLVAAGLPAAAGTYSGGGVTLTTSDIVYTSDDCFYSRYSLSGLDPEVAYYLTIVDPSGAVADADFIWGQASAGGRSPLCKGLDPVGRYTVTVEGEDEYGSMSPVVVGHFRVRNLRKASSSLSVSRTTLREHSWRIEGKLTRAGKPWRGHKVTIQVWVNGTWRPLSGKVTNKRGKVRWRSTPEPEAGQYVLRLHANGNSTTKPANSRTFRLPHRP